MSAWFQHSEALVRPMACRIDAFQQNIRKDEAKKTSCKNYKPGAARAWRVRNWTADNAWSAVHQASDVLDCAICSESAFDRSNSTPWSDLHSNLSPCWPIPESASDAPQPAAEKPQPHWQVSSRTATQVSMFHSQLLSSLLEHFAHSTPAPEARCWSLASPSYA